MKYNEIQFNRVVGHTDINKLISVDISINEESYARRIVYVVLYCKEKSSMCTV